MQQRAFSRSGFADDGYDLSALHIEINSFQYM
jgi:hypothetical protein